MSTTRQHKYARLIQKELSDIFQKDKRGILDKSFVTITEVKVSPDLGLAKVYISMLLQKDKQGIIEKLNTRKGEIRKALGDSIRKQARIVPELVFYPDNVDENASRIDEIIKKLNIPPQS